MDLLGEEPAFDVGDPDWKIHSRNPLAPPEYIGDTAQVGNSHRSRSAARWKAYGGASPCSPATSSSKRGRKSETAS